MCGCSGLLKYAIYGGRIDNQFDFRVLEVCIIASTMMMIMLNVCSAGVLAAVFQQPRVAGRQGESPGSSGRQCALQRQLCRLHGHDQAVRRCGLLNRFFIAVS